MSPAETVIGATNIRRDPAKVDGAPHLILVNSLATTGEMWDGVVTALDGEIDDAAVEGIPATAQALAANDPTREEQRAA